MMTIEISEEGIVFCGTLLCCLWLQDAMCPQCPLKRVIEKQPLGDNALISQGPRTT